MAAVSSVEPNKVQGPSGFLELHGHMLVVDYGQVYMEGNPVGFLFEDGYLSQSKVTKPIEEIHGCVFRGIDANGIALELPTGTAGPSGKLIYNGVTLNVTNGRIGTLDHRLVGEMEDDGTVYIRDGVNKVARVKLDENSQLTTLFEGKKSDGEPWKHEFVRPLYRKDKSYSDNEIIRYFAEFDKLKTAQKKYVCESMNIWAASGVLQVVRKSEGNCMLGNVKHGAAGVTGVRTGYVTLDREEFEKEITLFAKFGSSAVVSTRFKPYLEVRINLVVAHEFGHQLEFCLSQATQNKIRDLYDARVKLCDTKHPLPPEYEGLSELLTPQQVPERLFISGYARSSKHEYWAECVAAFSVKDSRDYLKKLDPEIYEILLEVVTKPENVMRRVFYDNVLELQSSLRVGNELTANLIN
ncbi:MAG: hypothetical protein JST89_20895 [Cyanobacteria bacterium SZAS-4]|nr:hypothetical protein [Cyanobacteria bacterium SZAS-4]